MEPWKDAAQFETWLGDLLERVEIRARPIFHRFGLGREDAEDLLQQTCMIFLRKRSEIHNPEAWMLGTIRNQCLMLLRRRHRSLAQRVDQAVLEQIAGSGESGQVAADLRHDLERVLLDVPERCHRLLRLRYLEGCEASELALQLGYKQSGIYKLVERCLAAFSRALVRSGFKEESTDDRTAAP